jgi:bacteriocin-like protein
MIRADWMEKIMSGSDYASKYHRSELENADGEMSEKELTAVIGGSSTTGSHDARKDSFKARQEQHHGT